MGFYILHVHNNSEERHYLGLVYVAPESKNTYSVAFSATSVDTRRNAWGMCVPKQQYHTSVGGFEEAQSELPKTQRQSAEGENAHRYFICFKLQCLETRSCVFLFT